MGRLRLIQVMHVSDPSDHLGRQQAAAHVHTTVTMSFIVNDAAQNNRLHILSSAVVKRLHCTLLFIPMETRLHSRAAVVLPNYLHFPTLLRLMLLSVSSL